MFQLLPRAWRARSSDQYEWDHGVVQAWAKPGDAQDEGIGWFGNV